MDDECVVALVRQLARPHASGGAVIERAAILAAGADSASVIAWIADHDGQPETSIGADSRRGLHGSRIENTGVEAGRPPLRYVLPAGTLS
jgi:hypothetical protein